MNSKGVLVLSSVKTEASHLPKLKSLLETANQVIVDKPEVIKLCMTAILAQGHILIEDQPGMGKTSLLKTIAKLLGLKTQRVQFTNDLLPADIIGTHIFNKSSQAFEFHEGPIFSNIVIADEINRASPKTQSACLQAMEEYRINSDRSTFELPRPFFLVATQNPQDNVGTFPLPDSQLDRFLIKIELGLPSREAEKEILLGQDRNQWIETLKPALTIPELETCFHDASKIQVSEVAVQFLQDIIEKSRNLSTGISPRAGRDFLKAAKAYAYLCERPFVIPEDFQAVGVAVMSHRLSNSELQPGDRQELAREILFSVPVP